MNKRLIMVIANIFQKDIEFNEQLFELAGGYLA
jgi:hypothetical protein